MFDSKRIAILDNLFQGLIRGDPVSRQRAMQMLGNMTDISDDENLPDFGAINTEEGQREAQMAADFVRRLHGTATATLSSSSGHVYRVADDLHVTIDERGKEPPADDCEIAEIRSQRIRRYTGFRIE